MIKKLVNYNIVEIYKDKVIKIYCNKHRLENEVKFNKIFSEFFIVPEVLDIKGNKVTYERLTNAVELTKTSVDLSLITDLINSFPEIYDKIESNRGLPINEKKGRLIHGDLRLPNIFIRNNEFALIDLEYAGYLDPNFDLAYLYFSILGNNKAKLAEQLVNYVKKEGNYLFFLKGCEYYSKAILENPRLNKKNIPAFRKNLIEIKQEIKGLGY